MPNSTFHQIYTSKIEKATNRAYEEDYKALDTIYLMYLSTVINTFKWKNVPKPMLPFHQEINLCYWGIMGAFKNDKNEFRMYPAFPSGNLLENGEYSRYTMVARDGTTVDRDREDICLCYNNSLCVPSLIFIKELSQKSTNALRAVDCALERSMIPAIIECESEEQMKTLSDLYDRVKNKLPFRLTFHDGVQSAQAKVLDAFDSTKYDMIQMWDVYVRYRNLFYTSFGINNVEIQKRERLTEAEGSGNDEITRYTLLDDMYERRKEFIEEVKEKFGIELEVELNRDSATVYNIELDNAQKIDDVQLNIMRGINTKGTPENVENSENIKEDDGNEKSTS